jgi:hypothetical protein
LNDVRFDLRYRALRATFVAANIRSVKGRHRSSGDGVRVEIHDSAMVAGLAMRWFHAVFG